MSEKDISLKPGKKSNLKFYSSGVFLNLIIVILVIIIAVMTYSLLTKIKGIDKTEGNNEDKAASDIIQVEVLNGCGITGIADRFTSYLRQHDFDVVQVGNYRSFDIDNSMVIDRTGNKLNAEKVAEALGISSKNVFHQINNDYFLDVSLIIGKDFNRLKPFN